jgi:hypothetical protein
VRSGSDWTQHYRAKWRKLNVSLVAMWI